MIVFNFKDIEPIKKTLGYALFIRLFCLFLVLIVFEDSYNPYFVVDDINYELQGQQYLDIAKGVFDVNSMESCNAFNNIAPFWPIVMCVSSKLFGSIYASRFLNISLSLLCIIMIFKIVTRVSHSVRTGVRASKLYAYLPLTVFLCCFPLKDIYLTFATLVFFNFIIITHSQEDSVKLSDVLFVILLGVGVHFCRGAIVELFALFLMASLFLNGVKNSNKKLIFFSIVASLIAMYLFIDEILGSFETKILDYQAASADSNLVSQFQVRGITTLYKLPFQYFIASLVPVDMNFFSGYKFDGFWFKLISCLNVSMIPVAVANMLYFIKKNKYDWFFWTCGVVVFSAVTSLSLSIFRHYMFLLPLQIMNCALFLTLASPSEKNYFKVGSVLVFAMLLINTYI